MLIPNISPYIIPVESGTNTGISDLYMEKTEINAENSIIPQILPYLCDIDLCDISSSMTWVPLLSLLFGTICIKARTLDHGAQLAISHLMELMWDFS